MKDGIELINLQGLARLVAEFLLVNLFVGEGVALHPPLFLQIFSGLMKIIRFTACSINPIP